MSFFVNHDALQVADFLISGAYALQLSVVPEFFCQQALNPATPLTPELISMTRFAGIFLISERLCFYKMVSSGNRELQNMTTSLSILVYGASMLMFWYQDSIFQPDFWMLNMAIQFLIFMLFLRKYILDCVFSQVPAKRR